MLMFYHQRHHDDTSYKPRQRRHQQYRYYFLHHPHKEEDLLLKSLKQPTDDQPQIPLPTVESIQQQQQSRTTKNSKSMPSNSMVDIFLTLTTNKKRPYGTDLLVLKVYRDQSQKESELIGGAKFPVAVLPSSFPVRVTLGPQNSILGQQQEWIQSTSSSLDLWIDGTICRPTSKYDDDDTVPSTSQTSTSTTSVPCPSNYQPLLQAKGISKYIMLPSSSSASGSNTNDVSTGTATTTTTTAGSGGGGIRAPATLQFQ